MRFVTVKNVRYVRIEDVVEYIREMAATEDADVRERFEKAAMNLEELKEKNI